MERVGGGMEKKKGGGVREEMPCIPLSGQRKTTERGEGRGGEETTETREKYRKRRWRGGGEGGLGVGG